MKKRSLLSALIAGVMLVGVVLSGCSAPPKDDNPPAQDGGTDAVAAQLYDQYLDWGEKNHLYVHYMR
ncbi:MAG: hypothetical protein K2I29_05085, partial [Clostridia bacterium]|nr:hypothetical protein [Clostridia bacterium]